MKIIYSAAEPRNAYRADGVDGWFYWIFLGSGIFLAAWASISLVVSLMLIAGGVYLFRSGRKDRFSIEEQSNFF